MIPTRTPSRAEIHGQNPSASPFDPIDRRARRHRFFVDGAGARRALPFAFLAALVADFWSKAGGGTVREDFDAAILFGATAIFLGGGFGLAVSSDPLVAARSRPKSSSRPSVERTRAAAGRALGKARA